MHLFQSLSFVALLLLIATPIISLNLRSSPLKQTSALSERLYEKLVQQFNLSSNEAFIMRKYKFYNGTHIMNRQIDPTIPAWEVPVVLRGLQTFVTTSQIETNYLMKMMGDMWELALAAFESLDTPEAPIYSSSFLRYFRVEEWGGVRDGFRALLGPDCDERIEGPEQLRLVRIYWDTGASAFAEVPDIKPADACENFPDGYGFGTSDNEDPDLGPLTDFSYWLVICPQALEYRTVLRPFDCSLLEFRNMYPELLTGGQMMLHEMMHWPYIALKAGKPNGIGDWNTHEITGDPLDPDAVPLSGYGPWQAMSVNKIHGGGSKNADNYPWFAYEAYLLRDKTGQCGGDAMEPSLKDFDDPIADE